MARSRPRSRPPSHPPASGFLGIEAGGTRTTSVWVPDDAPDPAPHPATVADAAPEPELRSFGPANLQLIAPADLDARLREVARAHPFPRALGIGMAGTRTAADRQRLRDAAGRVWPGIPCVATHDLDTALAADAGSGPGPDVARVLVLSGTGSCCFGRDARGREVKVGGWGHLLGDQGSGYALVVDALRRLVERHDTAGRWGPLGAAVLAALHRNEPDALIPWIHGASKDAVAALAPVVFQAAAAGDAVARQAVDAAADALVRAASAAARRIAGPRQPLRFVLSGGLLRTQDAFARRIARGLLSGHPGRAVAVVPLERPGAEGAAHLARTALADPAAHGLTHPPSTAPGAGPVPVPGPVPVRTPDRRAARARSTPVPEAGAAIPTSAALSPTEARNPRSMNLDRLSPAQAIDLMLSEDERIVPALRQERRALGRALSLVVRALRGGGRLFYVGAGTSGRLGVLDASECPPTFRTPPDLVQGIIAGGEPAMFRSQEGAEDDVEGGARAIRGREIGRRDVVVGIAASGRTPFVWGALAEARRRGAPTVLVCFNPHLRFARGAKPDVVIAPPIGPEVLTGSTRLKAGTATKLILNLFTTLAMVRLGKVVGNLMVDLNPANAKLRDRAIRIVCELTGSAPDAARAALEQTGWVVKPALERLRRSA